MLISCSIDTGGGFLFCKTKLEKWGPSQTLRCQKHRRISDWKPETNMVGGEQTGTHMPALSIQRQHLLTWLSFFLIVSVVFPQTAKEIKLWGLCFTMIIHKLNFLIIEITIVDISLHFSSCYFYSIGWDHAVCNLTL